MDAEGAEIEDEAEVVRAMGRALTAFRLHPRTPGLTDHARLAATMPPSERSYKITWRAAMPDHLWREGASEPRSDGIGVSVVIDRREVVLMREELTPKLLRQTRRWVVMSAEVPASTSATVIELRVDSGPSSNVNSDWCLITPPVVQEP